MQRLEMLTPALGERVKLSLFIVTNRQLSSFHEVPAMNLPKFPALGFLFQSLKYLELLHAQGPQTAFLVPRLGPCLPLSSPQICCGDHLAST